MANQRLNATITIGGALAASFTRTVGAVKNQLGGIGGVVGGFEQNQRRIGAAIGRNNAALADARVGVLDAVGSFYALQAAIGAPVREAAAFESAMADVKKVVDFPTPEGLQEFRQGLMDMSRELPLTVVGLTEIAAAAGQSGVAADQLLNFTEAAAKIGVAFDISAAEAGTAIAKLSTGLGISLEETVRLSDAMNHLSNSQASTAAQILDVVRRAGAQGKQFGYSAEETAAFASAMIAAGSESEVAATSFRAMGRALSRGQSATGRQVAAYETLGLAANDVALAMQTNAVDTTVDVMERISRLPAEMRAAISSDLFGDEARALGPLLTNLDLVRESMGMVANEADYAGSAYNEFAVRNDVFDSKMIKFKNTISALSITIGEALIPTLTTVMETIAPTIDLVSQFVEAHPQLASNVMLGVGALIAFRGALAALRFVGLLGKGGALYLMAGGMATIGRAGAHLWRAASGAIGLQSALARMGGQSLSILQRMGIGIRAVVGAIPGIGRLATAFGGVGLAVTSLVRNIGLIGPAATRAATTSIAQAGRMRRAFAGAGAAFGMFGVMNSLPDDPADLPEFQARNREAMDRNLRNTPVIGSAMRGYENLRDWVHGAPERAVGGSYGRGPVVVGERGPELRFENRAGFIATNRQMQGMAAMADRIRGAAAYGGQVVREAATIDVGGIVIHAAQGMDPRQIADEVMRRLREASGGALYDGGRT